MFSTSICDGLRNSCAVVALVVLFGPVSGMAAQHDKEKMMDKPMAEEKIMDEAKGKMEEMKETMKDEMPSEGMAGDGKMDEMKAHDDMKDHQEMKGGMMSKEQDIKESEMKSEEMMKDAPMKNEPMMDDGMKKNEMMK